MSHFERIELFDKQLNKRTNGSPYGPLRVEHTQTIISDSFVGATLNATIWTSTVANAGTNTLSNGIVNIRTNTTADGSARLESVNVARYINSSPNYFRTVLRLADTGQTNNVRRWGVFDTNNGFFFQLSGTTFSIVTRRATTDTVVNSGSFNNTASFAVNTNIHTYEIFYTDTSVYFFIDDVLYHTVAGSTATISATNNLKIGLSNTNSAASTTDVQMEVRSVSVNRVGAATPRPLYSNIITNATTILKYGAGTLHKIVLNKPGATANLLTIYDNTAASGTKIGEIDTTASGKTDFTYNVDFSTGLTILTATGTAADVTVMYD